MEKQNLFEQGSIRKTYFTLALPVTLSMVLSVVYNVADTYFIASAQDTNLWLRCRCARRYSRC